MMQDYELLEQSFAGWVGGQNPVACSSGTTALHLALEAMQLPLGSQVLVPEYTMVACARAVVMAGMVPVFVDCDDSLLMEPHQCTQLITPTTRAIMPVHVYGRQCDMIALHEIAKQHDLRIVEDCAEYHGGTLSGLADASCWSFYSNKIVAGEEGGMICFQDSAKATLAKKLRCQGFTAAHDFLHVPRGINGRLSNANAKLVLESLACADENLSLRSQVSKWYDYYLPAAFHMPPRDVCWVHDLLLPSDADMDYVVQYLNVRGIAARHGFKPMSMQQEFIGHCERTNACRLSRRVMYLPVHPAMKENDVKYTVALFHQALK